jgi:hypothetical protein
MKLKQLPEDYQRLKSILRKKEKTHRIHGNGLKTQREQLYPVLQ